MRKTKFKLFVAAIAAILITFMSQGTLAYYSTVGTATNVITSGNLKFIIHETGADGNPFPKEGVFVIPGDIVSKEVKVENVCDHPFYLRVKMVYGASGEELTPEECFNLNIDSENWIENDGWYYYKEVLEAGETTPVVFSHVEMVGDKISNSYIDQALTLTVNAHAVQSENNPADFPWEASGWPLEQ